VTAVGDDGQKDVVALLRLAAAGLDCLNPAGELLLVAEESRCRGNCDDLTASVGDLRQALSDSI
jgi:hypothetical protein